MRSSIFTMMFLLITVTAFAGMNDVQKAQIVENYGKIPLSFTANEGQIDSQVKFTTNGCGATMFFTKEGTTFLLNKQKSSVEKNSIIPKLMLWDWEEPLSKLVEEQKAKTEPEYYALKLRFVDANPNPVVVGEERLAWNTNYFIRNDPTRWQTDVSNYGKICLKDLYNSIDLVYYGNKHNIKYDFVVRPGANPEQILLSYDFGNTPKEIGSLSINHNGELIVKTPLGDVIERKPYAYQEIDGAIVDVKVGYKILDAASNRFTFEVGEYSKNYSLILDPELTYSTFLGGENNDWGFGIAIDVSGNAYVTGLTGSSNYPTTAGAFDQSCISGDAFVSKLNATGTSLLYSTFVGGDIDDYGKGITVDANGNAYVIGYTHSSNFPTTAGAFDQSYNGGTDVFVSKLNATGSSLLYSTFLGGNSDDFSWGGIAIDGSGNAYVTGWTLSSNFPTTMGAFDQSHNGGEDVFVSKLNATGSSLLYSTFLGGDSSEAAWYIAIDRSGNVYVTGHTFSSNYPTTAGAFDQSFNGLQDAFVSKLNATGSSLLYSTFLGGDSSDYGRGIVVDASGNAYVTGYTRSSNFPTTAGAFDQSYNGGTDVFVSKLNATGNSLIYSTFLGGDGYEGLFPRVAIDGSGNAYVTGLTSSSNYPMTAGAIDQSFNGIYDVFVSKVNPAGSSLLYSTFLGGDNIDYIYDMAIDGNGNMFVVGTTFSSNYPTTSGAYDQSFHGGVDVFVSKVNIEDSPQNTAPTALFNISPSSGTTIILFNFDASGSTDLQDSTSLLQVRWDWENNGTWDTPYSTTKTATHQFNTVGIYTINLEVKDTGGLTTTTTKPCTVRTGVTTGHFRTAYSTTGSNSTVMIPTSTTIRIDGSNFSLASDDEIAIYTPLLDTICCGVGKWNGSNLAITVWGDNDQTATIKEGFTSGQTYRFHIWDASESKEYRNFSSATFSSGNSTYSANGISVVSNLVFSTTDSLLITLSSGWNMISSNVSPQFPRMDSVFQSIVSNVVIVKNNDGQVYWPDFGVNQIGNLRIIDGYMVYMRNTANLTIKGQRVNPSTPISLPTGWSMISYLPNVSMSPARACSTIRDKIVIMKDVSGKVYWPRFNIDQIGTMQVGKGYQIYLSSAGTLTYPASVSKEGSSLIAESRNRGQLSPQHFVFIRGTGSNATILMRMNEKPVINGMALEIGDEIGVFTYEEICAGAGVWNGDDIVITVWGDNGETTNIDGFTDGQAYTFKLWDKSTNVEKEISAIAESGNLTYSENGITIISYEKSSTLPDNFVLRQNYPNPFNPSTRIEYQIKTQSEVTLAIYNTAGQLIRMLVKSSQNAGVYSVEWDGRNSSGIQVPSGIYLYRLKAGSFVETRKMVMMK